MYFYFTNKKGFLGTSIAGIVSIFLIFFILFFFVFASLVIAGKISFFEDEQAGSKEFKENFKKNKELEIKQNLILALNSPLEERNIIKEEFLSADLGETGAYHPVIRDFAETLDFYFEEDFCFEVYLEETFNEESIFLDVLSFGKIRNNFYSPFSCQSSLRKFNSESIYLLKNNQRIKIKLYVENE